MGICTVTISFTTIWVFIFTFITFIIFTMTTKQNSYPCYHHSLGKCIEVLLHYNTYPMGASLRS